MRSASLQRARLLCIAFGIALAACGDGDRSRGIAGTETVDLALTRPQTIPALREWAGAAGSFRLLESSRIVVASAGEAVLLPVANLFAADLRELTGKDVPVVVGSADAPGEGDLSLALGDPDARLGREGYRLAVGRSVEITAIEAAGAFYGTRTVLQLLRQGEAIPAGEALDWPRYPERGMMVDIGRKHFTPAWIEEHVRELAYLKLNTLHLHFTENQGWRIESERHPEVVSREHLSKSEVRDILDLAALHHITVVPEIDLPGHMGAALADHPELQLADLLGRRNPNNLDYTMPEARRFAFELIDEFLDLFPGPYWHTGADEYLTIVPAVPTPLDYALYPQLEAYARARYGPQATAKDGILGFVNEVNERVRARGKTLRVWNDGLSGGRAVALDPDVVVEWWTDRDGPSPGALLAAGHRILNAGWFPTYYVNGFPGALIPGYPSELLPIVPPRPDLTSAYQSWQVHRFHGPLFLTGDLSFPPQVIAPDEPGNLGSLLHLWNDDPGSATENQLATGIAPYLRVIAQKTWGSPPLTPSYGGFRATMGAVGHAPGYRQD